MKKLLFVAVCLLVMAPASFAQGRPEIFVGYSNLQAEGVPNPENPNQIFDDDFFDRRRGLNGFNASIAGYLSSNFGITGDFSYHRNEDGTNVLGGRNSEKRQVFYFMGGPRLKFRSGRFEPFVHALAGGAHTRFDVESRRDITGGFLRNTFETSSTDFAAAIGGGVDIKMGERFGIRAFQFDYAPVFLRDRTVNVLGASGAILPFTLEGQRQDNIRISVGIIF